MSYPPPTPDYAGPGRGYDKPQGMAVASLVLGILSFPVCCITPLLSIVVGVLAVALGYVARKQAREGRAGGEGMALAGLILGLISALLCLLLLILALLGLALAPQLQDWIEQQQANQPEQEVVEDGEQPVESADPPESTEPPEPSESPESSGPPPE